jgi:two-component system OmpR family sensor kinase
MNTAAQPVLPSIRQRLARVVWTVSLAWSALVFGAVWGLVHWKMDAVLDGSLQESGEFLYGVLHARLNALPAGGGAVLPAPPHEERLVWQVVDARQQVRWRSHKAPLTPLAEGQIGLGEDAHWHLFGMRFDDEGSMLYVAQPDGERLKAQFQVAGFAAMGALAVGALCALWLRRRVSDELTPMLALSRAVQAYQPMAEGASSPEATRVELLPLRDAVVHLGERLAGHVASERAFSANAAHALRTPLAGLSAQLALAQRECAPEVRPRIERAREAAQRLGSVVTALLSLFRAGAQPAVQSLDLNAFVRGLPVPKVQVQVEGQAQVLADPDLLAAALLNLFDNAVRYGATHVHCLLGTGDAGQVHLTLQDDGPGVDAATRHRLNSALAQAHYEQEMGLGLMLADRVARAHGGRVEVLPSEPGFRVQLSLPAGPGSLSRPG